MEASRAFQQGKPMLDDAAYDDLKRQLRIDRSPVVAQVLFLSSSPFRYFPFGMIISQRQLRIDCSPMVAQVLSPFGIKAPACCLSLST